MNTKAIALKHARKKTSSIMITIYDNQGKTIDRYTIFIDSDTECIGADLNGDGFYQHGEGIKGRHLGKQIALKDLSNALLNKLYEEITA